MKPGPPSTPAWWSTRGCTTGGPLATRPSTPVRSTASRACWIRGLHRGHQHAQRWGAYRAPGSGPQTMFSVEYRRWTSWVASLAWTRSSYASRTRRARAIRCRTAAPGRRSGCGSAWRSCAITLPGATAPSVPNEGVGVAVGGVSSGGLQSAAATCRLENDGTLTVVVGSVDVSGTNTGLVLLAAEALGIAPDHIRVVNADTGVAPFSGNASNISATVGRLSCRRPARRASS